MRSTSSRTIRRAAAVIAMAFAVTTACAPPDGGGGNPPTSAWSTTRFAFEQSGSGTVSRLGTWTTAEWFAYLEWTVPTGGVGSAELVVHPRTGAGAHTLGAPQRMPAGFSVDGLDGENFIGAGQSLPSGETAVTFYRPVAGTWGAAGSATIPSGYELSTITDDWLVARQRLGAPGTTAGQVLVYPLDTSGATVVAGTPSTLTPDPAWSPQLQQGYGRNVDVDGDLLAVSGSPYGTTGAGIVRLYRHDGAAWNVAETLTSPIGSSLFGQYVAVDDGASVDRIAMAAQGDSLATLTVDVFADNGTGFLLEQTIPRSSSTDLSGGMLLGYGLDLDGDLLAFTSRSTEVASAEAGHAPVKLGHVELHRLGVSGWALEHDLRVGSDPHDADVIQAMPAAVDISAGHVAVSVYVTGDAPAGCTFGCINIGFEAWSLEAD